MKFDSRAWVTDMAYGAIVGAIQGAVIASIVPGAPLADAIIDGGVVGLVIGMLPVRWLLELRPHPEDPE